MKRSTLFLACLAVTMAGTTAAQIGAEAFQRRPKLKPAVPAPRALPGALVQPGDALPGLGPVELQAFEEGREEFESVETPEGGLGPVFNGRSCGSCHSAGGLGGASAVFVTRFARVDAAGFDGLERLGGPLLQHEATVRAAIERVPAEANLVVRRITTPVFGAGLMEAITDETIVLGETRPKPDGVRGRAARVTDVASGLVRVGRFGWKAQQATLLSFAGDAYLNEMGITNRFFPDENAPNGNQALLRLYDPVRGIEDPVDPATGKGDTDHAADFMRFLAPPPPLPATASSLAGGRLFQQIGCPACHVPAMTTGPHPVPALAFQTVALWSDLLLHDMGSLGDGMEQGAALGREMRTAPLWGLRLRAPYLHDGRAATVHDAVRAHDGEAAPARNRYNALTPLQRQQVLDFMGTL